MSEWTHLNVGRHPIVRHGDATRWMRTVDVAMFAVMLEVFDEVVATKTNVARIGTQLDVSVASFFFGLRVRTHLETHKLPVRSHLPAWNECPAAIFSRTGDWFVTALGKMAIE